MRRALVCWTMTRAAVSSRARAPVSRRDAERMDQMINALRNNQIVQALGIIDEAGQVDIDALYNAAHAQMQAQGKLALDIPLLGSFAFDGSDLRELRDCIAQQEV